MVLSDRELQKIGPRVINYFDPRLVNPNSIDLRLGNTIRYPIRNENILIYGEQNNDQENWRDIEDISRDGLILNPGECVLACTYEKINLPADLYGQIFIKSTLGRMFINHMLAGVVDAGFYGNLTLEFKNDGVHSVLIPYMSRVVQLVLFRLDQTAENPYNGRYGYESLPIPARSIGLSISLERNPSRRSTIFFRFFRKPNRTSISSKKLFPRSRAPESRISRTRPEKTRSAPKS